MIHDNKHKFEDLNITNTASPIIVLLLYTVMKAYVIS